MASPPFRPHAPPPPTRAASSIRAASATARLRHSHQRHCALLNVTVTQPEAPGFLRLFSPLLASVPVTSNINFDTGQTLANNAIVGVYFYSFVVRNDSAGTVQLIVDVNGYFQ